MQYPATQLPGFLAGKRRYPTLITAHAGAEGSSPNTLESLEFLLGLGADAVEVDVRPARGTLVLSHDRPLFSAGLPTLAEAFSLLVKAPATAMNLDLKAAGLVPLAQRLAREAGVSRQCLFTGDIGPEDDRAILNGEIPLWLNEGLLDAGDRTQPLDAARRRGFRVLNIGFHRLNEALLAHPRRLSVWTVDGEDLLRRLLTAGVLNITTRRPLLALRLREELQQPQEAP